MFSRGQVSFRSLGVRTHVGGQGVVRSPERFPEFAQAVVEEAERAQFGGRYVE